MAESARFTCAGNVVELWAAGTVQLTAAMSAPLLPSTQITPPPLAPNPNCPAAFALGNHPLAGRAAAMQCFLGRCGQPRPNPQLIRRDFCAKLVFWRRESGWSLDSLATAIGVHPSTVSLWESGRRFPNLENLIALSTVMAVPPCHFFCPVQLGAAEPVPPLV
jgi:DNA-binding XRE family transcriptional regulator